MKKIQLFLIFLFCYSIIINTHAIADKQRQKRFARPYEFAYEVYSFMSSADPSQTTVQIHVSFCNDILQFVKESNFRFHAQYEILIALIDKKGNQVGGKTSADDIFVSTFEQTNSRNLSNQVRLTIDIVADEYKMVIELTDLDTRSSIKKQQNIKIRSFQVDKLALSDIIFSDTVYPESTTINKIVPNLQHNFPLPDSPYGAFIKIYPVSAEPLMISYVVKEAPSGETVFTGEETINVSSRMPVPYVISFLDKIVKVMKYDLVVKVEQGGHKAKVEGHFITSWNYFDSSSMTIEQSIEPMKHLVKTREWKWIQDSNDSTKDVWFRNFWKQRDPSPETDENELKIEYFNRVAYVTKNYSVPSSDKEGWDTDRGRIYLKYGTPTNIERRASSFNSPAYEIWHYNTIERRFIFEDRSGFGDFILIKVE